MITPTEYNDYYKRYIDFVQGESILAALESGLESTTAYFTNIPAEKHEYRYADGKWTPKEVLLHIIDTERVFIYRALQFSRADHRVLEGFDQDVFVSNAFANKRAMKSLVAEYRAVRIASMAFMASCAPETLLRMGVASESPLSVRAAAYIIAGHEIHHIAVLNERYF